jgi:hypothetical protein
LIPGLAAKRLEMIKNCVVWVMRRLTWYRLCATIPTWRVSTYQLSWLKGSAMLGALLWINWLGKLVLNGSRHLKITL